MHDAAACVLASTDGALPDDASLRAVAAAACAPEAPADLSLAPAVSTTVTVEGESLTYAFLAPGLGLRPLPAPHPEPVGTASWGDGAPSELRSAAELYADGASYAALEAAAEEQLALWKRGLAGVQRLDNAERAFALGQVRRALYRDLGLAALADGQPEVARPLLEEAAGAVPRPVPGDGRDPVLLAGLVSARFQSGELSRAAELAHAIAQSPGWEFADVVSQAVARVAVLPSPSQPRVRR